MPSSQEGPSIRGPYDTIQFVPSLYLQLTRFAGKGGAKPDGSIVAITNYCT